MALITESLATTTLQDWQAGAPERNTSITQLCKQSNWALASAGGWQWQHGGRIVNTGTILSGAQWWPVVCAPFGAQRIRVSVFGSCSSGGTEQIGVYLSDSWPFGAGVQVGLLTLTGTGAVATCEIDTSVYFGACLVYLKAETNIDDLELQGFRGRCVAAEPAGTALQVYYNPLLGNLVRFIQAKEFADASPLTAISMKHAIASHVFVRIIRGFGIIHCCFDGGQVRQVEELTQATGGAYQVLFSGIRGRISRQLKAYVRSYQDTATGDDAITFRVNGFENTLNPATTGGQTQDVWAGWEVLDLDGASINSAVLIDAIYASDPDAGQGHIIQDVSVISRS